MNPRSKNYKGIDYLSLTETDKQSVAILENDCPTLLEVIQAWPQLDKRMRKALLAMIREV